MAQNTDSPRPSTLERAVEAASTHVRNLYIAFLSLALYLAITMGGMTDEQLLRADLVRLPIVNVDVPLLYFALIAPLLFVLFHFNLLIQLNLLSRKLREFDSAVESLSKKERAMHRATLSQFVFSQMLVGQRSAQEEGGWLLQFLLSVMAWTTFVALPLVVLLLTQIQFLPYHDAKAIWGQRFLISLDLLLIWLLWLPANDPAIISRMLEKGRFCWRRVRNLRVNGRRRYQQFARWLASPFDWRAWPVIGITALFVGFIALLDRLRRRLLGEPVRNGALPRDWRVLRLVEITAVTAMVTFLVATMPEENLAIPVNSIVGSRGSLPLVSRTLVVSEAVLVGGRPTPAQIDEFGLDRAWANFGRPLKLRGRQLRYGVFSGSILERADLSNAQLLGATFESADLQRATFVKAALEMASFFMPTYKVRILWAPT